MTPAVTTDKVLPSKSDSIPSELPSRDDCLQTGHRVWRKSFRFWVSMPFGGNGNNCPDVTQSNLSKW